MKLDEIYNALLRLDTGKFSGSDNFGQIFLKLCAPYIASSLTYIFNRMIDTGFYPLTKNANVTPIFKTGDRTSANNNKAISFWPTLS